MKIFSFTFHTWGFVSAPVHSGLSPSTVYILCQNLKPPPLASFFFPSKEPDFVVIIFRRT